MELVLVERKLGVATGLVVKPLSVEGQLGQRLDGRPSLVPERLPGIVRVRACNPVYNAKKRILSAWLFYFLQNALRLVFYSVRLMGLVGT